MPIIPHSISTLEYATFGEKKLHKIFSQLYDESDDEYVWYEPPALSPNGDRDTSKKRFTDFIIFSQSFGILNLEVKDWKRDKIRKIDKMTWEIETQNGKLQVNESPFEQSRRCAYAIKNKLIIEAELTHYSGPHHGKLLFPFSFGVVFPHIERSTLYKSTGIEILIPPKQVLCKDDLDFDVSDKDQRFGFEKKLKEMFTTLFDFEPLSYARMKVLRRAIWPELEVTPVRTVSTSSTSKDIKILDFQQEDFAKSLGDGHYLIRGVAGSGKTLVLAYRTRYLYNLRSNWKILFVCYNKSLKNYVRKIIDNLLDGKGDKIEIYHFHELVSKKTGQSTALLPNESSEQWDARIGVNLRQAAMNNAILGGKYDAIMVDEAQDFSTEWLSGIRLILGKSDSLTIALDPAQDIYGRRRIWKEAGIDIVGGRRSRKLKQSYRNTNEILKLAIYFQGLQNYLEPDDDNPETILAPDQVERHGDKPVIECFTSTASLTEGVSSRIRSLVANGLYSHKDIGIILCSSQVLDIDRLKSNGVPIKELLQSDQRSNFDIDEDTVKIITVESSKGLEWKVVFLLGLDEMPRNNRELKHERNLVYIGITRAQEQLFVYYQTENGFITQLLEVSNKI
jgi:hypothetical protein